MEGRPRVHHPLNSYLEQTKEKNGMLRTRLKIPYWNRQEPQPPVDLSDEDICIIGSTTMGLPNALTDCSRGTADGSGFPETPDFTTTVIHQQVEDIVRSPADGELFLLLVLAPPPPQVDFMKLVTKKGGEIVFL